jgi:hypothetical protein
MSDERKVQDLLYPRGWEIVARVTLVFAAILMFLLMIATEGFYLAIGEIVGWSLLAVILGSGRHGFRRH